MEEDEKEGGEGARRKERKKLAHKIVNMTMDNS